MAETELETNIITQKEGERFALDHGGVALYGECDKPPMQHQFGGQVVHTTSPKQPLVHMVCWEQEEPCQMEVTIRGDEKAPVHVRMHHHFENEHKQTHQIEPLDHALKVQTKLAEPIHHALQMRTPLQLRFCNPWHVASDYQVEIRMGDSRLISLRLTGATVATPQPCEEEPCPPVVAHAGYP